MSILEIHRKIVHDVLAGQADCDGDIRLSSKKWRECGQPSILFVTGPQGYLAACTNPECVEQIRGLGIIVPLADLLTAATLIDGSTARDDDD